MSRYRTAFCTFLLLFLILPTYAQNPAVVRQIEITSTWHGWGTTPAVNLLIQKDHEVYRENGEPVDIALVTSLVKALQAPNYIGPSLKDLGITPEWLKANAATVARRAAETSLVNGTKPNAAALEASFADPETMGKIALGLFQGRHTDDDSSVTILVTFTDDTTLVAKTYSQWPLLLPWTVRDKEKQWTAYNSDISHAVAALLPEKATNRSRLIGDNLPMLLAQSLALQISRQEHMIEVEAQTGTTLRTLRKKYTVLSASINNYREWVASKSEPGEPSLLLDLTSPGLPSYFRENVALSYKNGSVAGADIFLRDAPQYEKLALSIPWLNRYLEKSRRSLKLFFVHDVSFTDAAFRLFAADMRAIGREELIPTVDSGRKQIALVSIGLGVQASEWLVFPDGRTILWRYRSIPTIDKTLLTWPIATLDSKPCSEPTLFLGCVGRVVDRDGNLN